MSSPRSNLTPSLTSGSTQTDRCVFTVSFSLVRDFLFGLSSILYHNTDHVAVTCF